MKGINKLELNQSTVCHALQLYLEHIMENAKIEVTSVDFEFGKDFVVTFKEKDEQRN